MRPQERLERLDANTFLGFQVRDFDRGGREQFIYLLNAGLHPDAKVMDLGCGILRAGYWLIHFLNPGGYCGIESHAGRLQTGLDHVLDAETLQAKRPRFDTNPRFDTSVFGERFDYFLAYSIWTHAAKPQIRIMLDAFRRDAKDDGAFLTTYLPAGATHPDYQGDQWFGTSHESNTVGCIYHNLSWIQAECAQRKLTVRELGPDRTYGQHWLEIRRA